MPKDPYRNFKFEVEILGFVRAGFQKVTGLKHSIESIDYREGGENETVRKLPGQSTYDDITFERGTSDDTDFIDWMNEIFNLDRTEGNQGDDETIRRKIVVYLKDMRGARRVKWTIYRAWPKEISDGDLDGTANDVHIETMIVANEGVKREKLN
jgi:phage tail-like protein